MSTNGRIKRHKRFLKKNRGSSQQPRLVIFRSNKHIYAQIVNDQENRILTGTSSLSQMFKEKKLKPSSREGAKEVGKLLAGKATQMGITKISFDKSGYKYHGKVRAIAEGAREGGLVF